jgi:hypothetical protein
MASMERAASTHVFWLGEDPAIRRWPVGPALLEMLGELNSDVRDTLADERARLSSWGYPEDFPVPALWWTPRAAPELVVVSD